MVGGTWNRREILARATGLHAEAGYLRLGSVWGIPIRLHLSWILVAALLTWTLAAGYYPSANPAWGTGALWPAAALGSLLVSASVLLHELGHAALAVRDRVPVKSINLLVFGGATRIGQRSPAAGVDFRIALAGPLASLALAGLFALLAVLTSAGSLPQAISSLLVVVNLLLAASNLIPAFPLDGGRALRALFWRLTGSRRLATRWATRSGQAVALAFMLLALVAAPFAGLLSALLLAAAGLYLWQVAGTSLKQLRLQERAAGLRARDVAMVHCLPVPGSLPLDHLPDDGQEGDSPACFLVTAEGGAQGLLLPGTLEGASLPGHEGLPASRLMTPIASLASAAADDDAWDLLERMVGGDLAQIPVTDNGRFLGLLTRRDLWNRIRAQAGQG